METNNNLYERYSTDEFKEVGKKRLTWNGVNENFKIVKINIDELKYNVLNGRIAELDLDKDTELDTATYTDIKNSIVASSKKDIEALGKNIAQAKLKEPLIVNKFGIIIDGNRRYTAINMLLHGEIKVESQLNLTNIEWVDVVILDAESDEESVKMLEYSIQFDDMKKHYDPISRAFDFARTHIKQKISVDKIAEATGIKKSEIEKDIRTVELIRIYLSAIGNPNDISLAKKLKLDGVFKEMASNPKQVAAFKQNQKGLVDLVTLVLNEGGDRTRNIRQLVKGNGGMNFVDSPIIKEKVKQIAEKANVKEIIVDTYNAKTTDEKVKMLTKTDPEKQKEIKRGFHELIGEVLEIKTKDLHKNKIANFLKFVEEIKVDELSETDIQNLKRIKELINV